MMLWLLLLAIDPVAEPPADPLKDLRGTVVAAIRNCGMTTTGEIVVCSRDKGYAEGERRLRKLKKPKPVDSGTGIHFEVTGSQTSGAPSP